MNTIIDLYIYRAADAFIYLPTYIAEEFKLLCEDKYNHFEYKVHWETASGDRNAIKCMEEYNKKYAQNGRGFAIAIADPTAMIPQNSNSNDCDLRDLPNLCLIATVINKLIFWAVGKKKIEHLERNLNFSQASEELRNNYQHFIHYNRDYETGYALGMMVKSDNSNASIKQSTPCAYSEEFIKLNQFPTKECPISPESVCIISTDLLSVADAIVHKECYINYSFSKSAQKKESEYLMSGIITTQEALEKYENNLAFIIQSFRKSISLLYSSRYVAKIAFSKLNSEASGKVKKKIDEATIDKMIEIIFDEEFYPCDMEVSKKLWKSLQKTVKEKTKEWTVKHKHIIGSYIYYQRRVNNYLLYKSGYQLSLKHGINYATLFIKGEKWRYNIVSFLLKLLFIPLKLDIGVYCNRMDYP